MVNETYSLKQFGIRIGYERIEKLGDPLEEINKIINWNVFRKHLYQNDGVGRHGYNPVLLLKMLVLQNFYGISDEQIEYQVADRISFQRFLDFPNSIPDYTTIWKFREELGEKDTLENIWNELKVQLELKGIKFNKGVIQDAKFIHADPGKTNSGMDGRGREARTSRSADGSWTKKGKKNIFGFKLHTKVDLENKFISELAMTTAKTHDGRIDLAKPDEIVYRDRGYTYFPTKAMGDATMKRGKNLTPQDKIRNDRISKKRIRVEHPYATMVRSLKAGYTKLTTLTRVYTQQLFVCFNFNLLRLKFILKNKLA